MMDAREEFRQGLEYLATVTTLLQRIRVDHPTEGHYEAAELQWFWSIPRSTDTLDQLFWFDDAGEPVAAAILADFGNKTSALYTAPVMIPMVMNSATDEFRTHILERGLAHAAAHGIESVEIEVDQADELTRSTLLARGFEVQGEGLTLCALVADQRPEITPLAEGYRLLSRSETASDLPHHMADERRPDVEERLRQTSLYRPDLDLVVLDADNNTAGYVLFWYDPVTTMGVVEPVRTEDEHQKRGIARHLLTTGITRLVTAGATIIDVGYEPDNPASGPLYRSIGFKPQLTTDMISGPTT